MGRVAKRHRKKQRACPDIRNRVYVEKLGVDVRLQAVSDAGKDLVPEPSPFAWRRDGRHLIVCGEARKLVLGHGGSGTVGSVKYRRQRSVPQLGYEQASS